MRPERLTERQLLRAALVGAVASSPIVAAFVGAFCGWNPYTVLSLLLGGGVLWYTFFYVLRQA